LSVTAPVILARSLAGALAEIREGTDLPTVASRYGMSEGDLQALGAVAAKLDTEGDLQALGAVETAEGKMLFRVRQAASALGVATVGELAAIGAEVAAE
jgi:hypothetical protein